MRNVGKASEFFLSKSLTHAPVLGLNALLVVGNFHLDEGKRQTVDKKRDVGSEAVFAVAIGQFGRDFKNVIRQIFKVNQSHRLTGKRNAREKFFVKTSAQICGGKEVRNVADYEVNVPGGKGKRVNFVQHGAKTFFVNVRLAVKLPFNLPHRNEFVP